MTPREIVAAAIADVRGMRRGAPKIENVLEVLRLLPGQKLYREVLDDADAVLAALGQPGLPWRPIAEAKKDGFGILAFGIHDRDSPPGASRQVKAGDHWWAILVWDDWRDAAHGGERWVFAKDGAPAWSAPLYFVELTVPDEVRA
jgi:hypothetical protein